VLRGPFETFDSFIVNPRNVEVKAIDTITTIERDLADLGKLPQKYGVEKIRIDSDDGKYFDDIWPVIHTISPEPNVRTLFVDRILHLINKLTAWRESAQPSANGVKCYSIIYVWNIQYLVVCLTRLMYIHLAYDTPGQNKTLYMNNLQNIRQSLFKYSSYVSGLYDVQILLMPSTSIELGAQPPNLEYDENRRTQPRASAPRDAPGFRPSLIPEDLSTRKISPPKKKK
jgi:hypothetical protein